MDEGTLRERFPEIPWDQPQEISVLPVALSPIAAQRNSPLVAAMARSFWVCRYCVCMYGVKASDLLDHRVPFAFQTREHALDHVDREHHD